LLLTHPWRAEPSAELPRSCHMSIGHSSLLGRLVVSFGAVVALADCGQLPHPPTPTAGGDRCGTVQIEGTRAVPQAGTGMDAESCILVALHECRPGVGLVVYTFGTDTSDTTTYTVEASPCRLAVSDTFFSPAVAGGKLTTYTCRSASGTAQGLQITGCALAYGSTQTIPTLVPALKPVASASPTRDPTAGWVSYTSAVNHLTFRHPADMQPLECGWVFIDPANPTSCPQGDGLCCVFLRSSDNGQTGAFSLISTNPNLYPGGIQRDSVVVDGVTGARLYGIQTSGQGGGPQVEYDFATHGRTYNFFADVGGHPDSLEAGAPSTNLFDQIVQTVIFTG